MQMRFEAWRFRLVEEYQHLLETCVDFAMVSPRKRGARELSAILWRGL